MKIPVCSSEILKVSCFYCSLFNLSRNIFLAIYNAQIKKYANEAVTSHSDLQRLFGYSQ